MNDFGLPPRVKPEAQLRLVDHGLLETYAKLVFANRVNPKQHRAVQNFTESAIRLSRKRVQVTEKAGTWGPPRRFSEEQQHFLYDLNEGYFQGVYNTLSKLAAVTVVFPEVFAGFPVRSMEKFLGRLREVPEISEACDVLEQARTYRTHLDHPAGTPVSNWMSTWLPDDRGVVIYHFGQFGQSRKMPEGAEAPPPWFPMQMDWYVDPPFIPYVDEALGTVMGYVFTAIAQNPTTG